MILVDLLPFARRARRCRLCRVPLGLIPRTSKDETLGLCGAPGCREESAARGRRVAAELDLAEQQRFATCLACHREPRRGRAEYTSLWCSERCEEAYFGRAEDWSLVYLEEVQRFGERPAPPRFADGRADWPEGHFVRRHGGVYLDLTARRFYQREASAPPARLAPLARAPWQSLRPLPSPGGRPLRFAEGANVESAAITAEVA